jgi:hypothetical protein
MTPKAKTERSQHVMQFACHKSEHGWGVARKEPKFRVEMGDLMPTGRIIHIAGGNALRRDARSGNQWRGVKP